MHVYNLINSRDIGKYCEKIKYQFNTIEIAVIINRCKKIDIDKKIDLYQDILDNYPDMEISTTYVENIEKEYGNQTIKKLVQEEIGRIKKAKQDFFKSKSELLYIFEPYCSILHEMEDIKCFNIYLNSEVKYRNSYSKIIEVATNQVKEGIYKTDYYNIVKKSLYSTNDVDVIAEYFVKDGNSILSNIKYNKYVLDEIHKLRLCDLCINIPIPFERGDILVNWKMAIPNKKVDYDNVFVLEELFDKGFGASGYKSSTICNEYFRTEYIGDYDNFEYYKGELNGNNRILKPISSYLKNKISLEEFLNGYKLFKNWYALDPFLDKDEEKLKLIGFSKEEIGEVIDCECRNILTTEEYNNKKYRSMFYLNSLVDIADEETLEEIYTKVADKQIENIKLKLKDDVEHIIGTNNLENIEESQIKQTKYDYYKNTYILLNNGSLYINKTYINSKTKELYLLDNFHIYSITTNNMMLPLKELEEWDNLDLYLYNEGEQYKKIINTDLHFVGLKNNGEIIAYTFLPGVAIEQNNFIDVDDIKLVKVNEDVFDPYIIKENQEIPLYIN